MKKYGITGGIASGKSTFCQLIKDLSLPLIDCDELVHKAYEPEGPIFNAVLTRFGEHYLNEEGQIDRRKLGREIFTNGKSREALNQITHPIISSLVLEALQSYVLKGEAVVFVDVPLLFEENLQGDYDGTILIDIEETLQIERLMQRNHFTFEEALSRIEAQMPLGKKRLLATYVLENNSTLEVFQAKGRQLIDQLISNHSSHNGGIYEDK